MVQDLNMKFAVSLSRAVFAKDLCFKFIILYNILYYSLCCSKHDERWVDQACTLIDLGGRHLGGTCPCAIGPAIMSLLNCTHAKHMHVVILVLRTLYLTRCVCKAYARSLFCSKHDEGSRVRLVCA